MRLLTSIIVMGVGLAGVANAAPNLSTVGGLVRTNAAGDYRYAGASAFLHSGTRGYVNEFAIKLANGGDVAAYEDVMKQGILQWEDGMKEKGFSNDVASALAFFTAVNLSFAKKEEYKDFLIPNLVSQYRKALASKTVGTMANAKKQDYYDYMVAQSVYMQALASSGRDRDADEVMRILKKTSTGLLRETFGANPLGLSISESGLAFN